MFRFILNERAAYSFLTTETKVKQSIQKIQLAHFATHGEFDYSDSRNGQKILLTQDEEDGALNAQEIGVLDFSNIRLVVLIICNGAVCRYSPSDEPLGILSAFFKSGVENILAVLLWELPDAASKIFILDFYRELLSTNNRQSAWLRSSQHEIWYNPNN